MQTAERVRKILSTRGLTLSQVSRRSAEIFGRSSPYYVPEHFYSVLLNTRSGPRIHQVATLSRILGYRLSDCLAVFGLSLDDIPRLQTLFPRRRTLLLDTLVYDENEWIPWFAGGPRTPHASAVAPLAQILKPAPPRRAHHLLALNSRRFLYAKIGREDILAFPDLAPGSIARIDPSRAGYFESTVTPIPAHRIFLIETASRLASGHLRRVRGNRVALYSTSLSYPPLELTLGRDATVIGVVDAEIRPVGARRSSGAWIPSPARKAIPPRPLEKSDTPLSHLIRRSRIRQGLSFREASAMSSLIAEVLADRHYFASPGTLSESDRLAAAPRHIQKILSLCILYGIDFWDFLRSAGLPMDSLGNEPMPDDLRGRISGPNSEMQLETPADETEIADPGDFLSVLIGEWKEIPLFIRHSLRDITGLPHLSLLDFFFVGAEKNLADPRLRNATLITVNRRLKKPLSPPPPPREQPVYVLLTREGGYLCAPCTLDSGVLALHRQPSTPLAPVETEARTDLEVIGQVTAILRHLS